MQRVALFIQAHYNTIQRSLFGVLLLGFALFFSSMAFRSTGILEPGDGIVHYHIAKYAWQNPELFLDHWGKPIFTFLSSPFAQIGFPGMILFNSVLFSITGILLYSWAEKRKNPFAWLVPLFLVSSYIYFDMVNAGMTEILFATILTATVYLFFQQKYILGSVIFSFALFSRPEGNVIMPIFFLFLFWKKQWKAIPFLATAFVIYSIIGYFFFKDFLWYIHHNPYPAVVDFYGHGTPFHFLNAHISIWGLYMRVFSIAAILCVCATLFTKKWTSAIDYLLLLILPGIAVFVVHSYIWWKGIHGSLGLIRVLATVVPLFIFLSLYTLNRIKYFSNKFAISVYSSLTFLAVGFILAFLLYKQNVRFTLLPVKETTEQTLLSEAAEWYLGLHNSHKIFYSDPYFAFKAGINPFDTDNMGLVSYLDKNDPSLNLQSGDIISWETHFGPNESGLAKEKLIDNPNIELLKTFVPSEPILDVQGNPYEILIFRVK